MAISMIRRVINMMPEGTIFTTRDMLVFGMRTAVDQALCTLVRKERIRRLARGVFAKCDDYRTKFTELQIVKAKAHSFGRRIIEKPLSSEPINHGLERVKTSELERIKPHELEQIKTSEMVDSDQKQSMQKMTTYCVEGHSSTFRIGDKIIHFKKVGQRKFELAKSRAGAAAHEVWQLGASANDGVALSNAILHFDRTDYVDLRRNIQWMPAWLSDQIKWRPWDRFYDNWAEVRPKLGLSSE